MCLAENIYYVDCGCWEGQHIRWECPRSGPRGGACPDVECSGVFRKWGRCLVCERRQTQQQQQHALIAGDHNDDDVKVTLLREVLRQILGVSDDSAQSDETIASLGDGQARKTADIGLVSSQGAGRNDSTAWHRRWDICTPENETRRHGDAPGTRGTWKVVPKPERWTLDRCCCQHRAGSHECCGDQDAAPNDKVRGRNRRYCKSCHT
ncbi:hypothetical protein CI238_07064 [Colletotrichum incanum]|uniref:Uncharacterized protein n=1 Tax=Colletotrichum incanum TaxID=1573173 RepID=A0A166ZH00_COLIC|nr:hypothetical protein CI238_07064 [Colletotrichum incanum]